MSNPPIGGITPLKMFKYGSVIEQSADNAPLFQSMLGNHVKRTLTRSKKEYILRVSLRTLKIDPKMSVFIRLY